MGYDMFWKSQPAEVETIRLMIAAYHEDEEALKSAPRQVTLNNGQTISLIELKQTPDQGLRQLHQALDEAESRAGSYFRTNIWGMGIFRQEMLLQGMGHDEDLAMPDIEKFNVPKVPYTPKRVWDPELKKERAGEERDTVMVYDQNHPGFQAYSDAFEQALNQKVPDTFGIALVKLCSNSGFVIVPKEIEEALSVAQSEPSATFTDEVGSKRWRLWLDFLKDAANHDGVVVL